MDRFGKKLRNEEILDEKRLEEIIQEHCQMSKWIADCDQFLKRICAVMLSTNIPLTTMLIYLTIMDQEAILATRLVAAGWSIGQILQIVAFSSSASINSISENFYDTLYCRYVKWSETTEFYQPRLGAHLQRINLLLNRMAIQQVGFTVWDLVPINKSTLITTFSLVFTYFMLVVEFVNPNGSPTICNCNCNGTAASGAN